MTTELAELKPGNMSDWLYDWQQSLPWRQFKVGVDVHSKDKDFLINFFFTQLPEDQSLSIF